MGHLMETFQLDMYLCNTPRKFNIAPEKFGGWKATFILGR